ncbi:WXG100 family type VII secretion target [Bacillus sp. DX1.1]|uniref:WXG100 family type VII secretion target n=1 Tax=unclassified Bacillus (in: firmicutes) TaxID=185979 RepID=UPI0025712336|nr:MULTISPECIES: WXG100 family type VII secretion target [unclassified Bacillus (in: firmicutes)]MDM5154695.1 WXG100 family type VII secretion target [Bacillus sp. DX1.1]WJE83583.1 WXG100 family type VII secretion target [Bacillus sp. DX3.1]
MAEIKITPEQLEQIASNFTNAASEAQQQINRLEGDINNLEGQWSGATQAKFRGNFNESKQAMQQYIPILQHISEELKKIANNFRNVDNSY